MQKLPRLGRPTRGVAKTHFGSYGEPDGQAQGTILRCERCDGLRAKRKPALSKTLGDATWTVGRRELTFRGTWAEG